VPYPSNRQKGRKTENRKTEEFYIMHDSTELPKVSEISTLQCRHTLTVFKELTPQKMYKCHTNSIHYKNLKKERNKKKGRN
jgi:hypothetical protein